MSSMKNAWVLLCAAILVSLAGCASSPKEPVEDLEPPAEGEKFVPAVGYMESCDYQTQWFFNNPVNRQNEKTLKAACQLTSLQLLHMDGLTLKQSVKFPLKYVNLHELVAVANKGGNWIDSKLESESGAKYRVLMAAPFASFRDKEQKGYISYVFVVQRIADGKVMQVQSNVAKQTLKEAVTDYLSTISRVLNNPLSVPPDEPKPSSK